MEEQIDFRKKNRKFNDLHISQKKDRDRGPLPLGDYYQLRNL